MPKTDLEVKIALNVTPFITCPVHLHSVRISLSLYPAVSDLDSIVIGNYLLYSVLRRVGIERALYRICLILNVCLMLVKVSDI